MAAILGLYFIFLGFVLYKKYRDLFHPCSLFGFLWGSAALVDYGLSDYRFMPDTLAFYFFAVTAFCLFGFFGGELTKSSPAVCRSIDLRRTQYFYLIVVVISIIFLYRYSALVISGLAEYLVEARQLAISGESHLAKENFIMRKVPELSFIGTSLIYYACLKKNKILLRDWLLLGGGGGLVPFRWDSFARHGFFYKECYCWVQ